MKISRGTVVAPREPAATEMATLSAIEVAPPESLGAYAGDRVGPAVARHVGAGTAGTNATTSARAARQRQHEAAHASAAYLSGWMVEHISATPGANGSCAVSAPEGTDALTAAISAARIYLAADAWVRFALAPLPNARESYAVINEEPSAGELMSEFGWSGEPPPAAYYTGTDEPTAREICGEVSGDGLSAALLYRWVEREAELLVQRAEFARLTAALVRELEQHDELSGSRARSLLIMAEARTEGLVA